MRTTILCVLLGCLSIVTCCAATCVVTGAVYHADKPFPEFMRLWQEGWSLKDANGDKVIYARPDMPLGGYLFIYFRSTGMDPVRVTDLTVEGIRLSEGIGVTDKPESPEEKFGASVLLSKLPKEQVERLKLAGQPVWWKQEPGIVPSGGMGEIVVRMKRSPAPEKIAVGLITGSGTVETQVLTRSVRPRLTTIAFSSDLQAIYLYARHPKAGIKPTKVFMDGQDVTASTRIASDRSLDLSPIIIRLSKPLEWMSYHNFRASYPDGSAAVAGIRAWGRDMIYGMWGAGFQGGKDAKEAGQVFLKDWALHNINCHMGMCSGPGADYFHSEEGWDFSESVGISRMTTWSTGRNKPALFFLQDEPDAHDFATGELHATERLGSLGQWLVKWQEALRKHGPETPVLLNIDNTYKPENWYMYHQLADVPCVDPYYPEQLDYVYRSNPGSLAVHSKPTYVLGVSSISQSSCQPKPLHVILCSTKYLDGKGYEGRYPTPEEKRMEAYYAISSGAKGLSYWWFSPDAFCRGIGTDDPPAKALWKEIGLLGAELRTAGSVITRSCPISLPVKGTPKLMFRTCIAGTDTVELFAVNDDVACDRVGTVVKPVEKASATVEVPSWLTPADAFEVTAEGLKGIPWKREGSEITLDLQTVNAGRFVMVTSDAGLRARLQAVYDRQFAANVKALLAP